MRGSGLAGRAEETDQEGQGGGEVESKPRLGFQPWLPKLGVTRGFKNLRFSVKRIDFVSGYDFCYRL